MVSARAVEAQVTEKCIYFYYLRLSRVEGNGRENGLAFTEFMK
jgi:hypothetical protein